jgi:hypothetical protein
VSFILVVLTDLNEPAVPATTGLRCDAPFLDNRKVSGISDLYMTLCRYSSLSRIPELSYIRGRVIFTWLR